jgi:pimeloyl-ACP methyl ester carboxylesterase
MTHLVSERSRSSLAQTSTLLLFLLLILALTGALAACGDTTTTDSTEGSIPGKQVTFTTEDDVLLSGHTFGSGDAAVVLSHMYPADQKSWYPTAKELAAEGYFVLTYDFRGYGLSEGAKEIKYIARDVFAAVQTMAASGATRVVLIGASMGGTASLVAAEQIFAGQLSSTQAPAINITVAGVATLSAPVNFEGLSAENAVEDLYCPLLFIAAKEDVGADGALELERLSGNSGQLEIVSGSDHGTDLLEGNQADRVYKLLLEFLRKNLPLES